MTGNNKFWRASLAGLASVAMLATMGVAASTANADDAVDPETPTIYLNANGGKFSNGSAQVKAAQDGVADYNLSSRELHAGGDADWSDTTNVAKAPTAGAVFTGWYYGPQAGSEAYKPGTDVAQGTVLYAHWSKTPTVLDFSSFLTGPYDSVYSDFYNPYGYEPNDTPFDQLTQPTQEGLTSNIAGNSAWRLQAGLVLLAEGDHAATWQLPYDKDPSDRKVDDWSVVNKTWDWTKYAVAISYKDLTTTDFWKTLPASYWKQNDAALWRGTQRVYLYPTAADAQTVSFSVDGVRDGKNYEFTNESSRKYISGTNGTRSFNVKAGEAVNVRVDSSEYAAYQVNGAYGELRSRKVTKWADDEGAPFAPSDFNNVSVDRDWNLDPAETKLTYTVTFLNGGAIVDTQEVEPGKTAKAPAAPKRDGYKFLGWTNAAEPTTQSKLFDFSTKIYQPLTLSAVWQAAGVSVTFDPNWGTAAAISQSFSDGSNFAYPAAPARDGYEFAGWYTTKPASTLFDKASSADKYLGVKLRITTAADGAKLQYLATTPELGANGAQSEWKNLPTTTFYAGWKPAKEQALVEQELKAPAFYPNGTLVQYNDKSDEGDFARFFSESSWNAYLKKVQDYQAAKHAAGSLTKDEIAKLYQQLVDAQKALVQNAGLTVYRLYNQYNGDHVYTAVQSEYEYLRSIGWTPEGPQFTVTEANAATEAGYGTAVYRLYNSYNGEHLFTTDTAERDNLVSAGWTVDYDGKPAFYAPQGGATPVTRLFNKYATVGTHLYSTDASEIAKAVEAGWVKDNPDVIFNAK